MGSGSPVVDTSNEITRGQLTPKDLFKQVLTLQCV